MGTTYILQILRTRAIEAVKDCDDIDLLDLVYKMLLDSLEE